MMDFVKSLFEDKLVDDDRSPYLLMNLMEYDILFFAPNPSFFVQIMLVRFISRWLWKLSQFSL
jgi:hypothetical protein